ncbi:copper resistance D family protein [Planktotalea arctica]|uniref:copper resistance D family protein n=1 Tax=Planktotalea arctica TaxID=1481893 RepID=UPI000A1768D9|nr:CopD family protein [Planktotalea arctica]
MIWPDGFALAVMATKFALYLGVLGAAGTVMAALMFRLERTRALAGGFAIVGAGAALFDFSLRGGNLAGEMSGMIDPEMLGLLWSTSVGTALLLRLCGLGLLITGLFMARAGPWVSVVGGVIAIFSFLQVGHISARDTTLLDLALTLHLLAIALWIGILVPLKRLTYAAQSYAMAADVGHRFGVVASVTVPALILVGGYMGYQLVGSFSALVGSGYGQALIIKAVLFAALLGLGALNKLRFVPALRIGDPAAATHLRNSIRVEGLIILGILGVSAILTSNLALPL